MKNNAIKIAVPEFMLNSLNIALVERTVVENYELHFYALYDIGFVLRATAFII